MANKPEYLEFIVEWLSPLGPIATRAMFGGHTLYCDGIPFALLADNTLFLKVDDLTRGQYESRGLRAFQPFPDKPGTMQYYPPPPEFFEDTAVRDRWGRAAVEAGRRAEVKRRPKKRAARGQ